MPMLVSETVGGTWGQGASSKNEYFMYSKALKNSNSDHSKEN
jgi:hypothetical protein